VLVDFVRRHDDDHTRSPTDTNRVKDLDRAENICGKRLHGRRIRLAHKCLSSEVKDDVRFGSFKGKGNGRRVSHIADQLRFQ
jgi:hypothetical protein